MSPYKPHRAVPGTTRTAGPCCQFVPVAVVLGTGLCRVCGETKMQNGPGWKRPHLKPPPVSSINA